MKCVVRVAACLTVEQGRHLVNSTPKLFKPTRVVLDGFRDSPTIMMWDVLNEPRCPGRGRLVGRQGAGSVDSFDAAELV